MYVAAVALAAVCCAVALVGHGYVMGDTWTSTRSSPSCMRSLRGAASGSRARPELSIALLPTVFAAVVFGPLAEPGSIAAASMLGDTELFRRRDPARAPRLKWATYTSSQLHHGRAAGLTAQAVLEATNSGFGAILAATSRCRPLPRPRLRFQLPLRRSIRGRGFRDSTIRSAGGQSFTSILAYAPVVVVLVLAYDEISP